MPKATKNLLFILTIATAAAVLGGGLLWLGYALVREPAGSVPVAVAEDPETLMDEQAEQGAINYTHADNGDGTSTMTFSLFDTQYLADDGAYAPISTEVLESAGDYAFENTENIFKTHFRGSAAVDSAVEFAIGERSVGISFVGASESAPVAAGNTVTYPGVYGGMDARYTLLPEQLLEELIVTEQVEVSRISQKLILSNVYYKEQPDGSLTFHDADTRRIVWYTPAPVMYEIPTEENSEAGSSSALHYEVEEVEGGFIVHKVIDAEGIEWLKAASYPLVIDGTFTRDTWPTSSGSMYGEIAWEDPLWTVDPGGRSFWTEGYNWEQMAYVTFLQDGTIERRAYLVFDTKRLPDSIWPIQATLQVRNLQNNFYGETWRDDEYYMGAFACQYGWYVLGSDDWEGCKRLTSDITNEDDDSVELVDNWPSHAWHTFNLNPESIGADVWTNVVLDTYRVGNLDDNNYERSMVVGVGPNAGPTSGPDMWAYAPILTVTYKGPPPPPNHFEITGNTQTSVALEWQDESTTEDGWIIQYGPTAAGPWTDLCHPHTGSGSIPSTGVCVDFSSDWDCDIEVTKAGSGDDTPADPDDYMCRLTHTPLSPNTHYYYRIVTYEPAPFGENGAVFSSVNRRSVTTSHLNASGELYIGGSRLANGETHGALERRRSINGRLDRTFANLQGDVACCDTAGCAGYVDSGQGWILFNWDTFWSFNTILDIPSGAGSIQPDLYALGGAHWDYDKLMRFDTMNDHEGEWEWKNSVNWGAYQSKMFPILEENTLIVTGARENYNASYPTLGCGRTGYCWKVKAQLMLKSCSATLGYRYDWDYSATGLNGDGYYNGEMWVPAGQNLYDSVSDADYMYLAGTPYGLADGYLRKHDKYTGYLCNGTDANHCGIGNGWGDADSGTITIPESSGIRYLAIDSTSLYLLGSRDDGISWQIEKRSLATGDRVTAFSGDGVFVSIMGSPSPSDIIVDNNYLYVIGRERPSSIYQWRIEKYDKNTGDRCDGGSGHCGNVEFGSSGIISFSSDVAGDAYTPVSIEQDDNHLYISGVANSSYTAWRIEKRVKDTGALGNKMDILHGASQFGIHDDWSYPEDAWTLAEAVAAPPVFVDPQPDNSEVHVLYENGGSAGPGRFPDDPLDGDPGTTQYCLGLYIEDWPADPGFETPPTPDTFLSIWKDLAAYGYFPQTLIAGTGGFMWWGPVCYTAAEWHGLPFSSVYPRLETPIRAPLNMLADSTEIAPLPPDQEMTGAFFAKNGDGEVADPLPSGWATTRTRARNPLQPLATALDAHTVQITMRNNSAGSVSRNPAWTDYALQNADTGQYLDPATGLFVDDLPINEDDIWCDLSSQEPDSTCNWGYPSPDSVGTVTFNNAQPALCYELRAKSRNKDKVEGEFWGRCNEYMTDGGGYTCWTDKACVPWNCNIENHTTFNNSQPALCASEGGVWEENWDSDSCVDQSDPDYEDWYNLIWSTSVNVCVPSAPADGVNVECGYDETDGYYCDLGIIDSENPANYCEGHPECTDQASCENVAGCNSTWHVSVVYGIQYCLDNVPLSDCFSVPGHGWNDAVLETDQKVHRFASETLQTWLACSQENNVQAYRVRTRGQNGVWSAYTAPIEVDIGSGWDTLPPCPVTWATPLHSENAADGFGYKITWQWLQPDNWDADCLDKDCMYYNLYDDAMRCVVGGSDAVPDADELCPLTPRPSIADWIDPSFSQYMYCDNLLCTRLLKQNTEYAARVQAVRVDRYNETQRIRGGEPTWYMKPFEEYATVYTSIDAPAGITFNNDGLSAETLLMRWTGLLAGVSQADYRGESGVKYYQTLEGAPDNIGDPAFMGFVKDGDPAVWLDIWDSGLMPNRKYCYQAEACNGDCDILGDPTDVSARSPVACQYTLADQPAQPVLRRNEGETEITLSIRTNADDRNSHGEFIDPYQNPDTDYALCVTSYDDIGNKVWSHYADPNWDAGDTTTAFIDKSFCSDPACDNEADCLGSGPGQCSELVLQTWTERPTCDVDNSAYDEDAEPQHWATYSEWNGVDGVLIDLVTAGKYDFMFKARNGDNGNCSEGINECTLTDFGPPATLFLVRNNVVGWAWSSTAGWLSLNCLNFYSEPSHGYSCNRAADWGLNTAFAASRTINPLEGYAWSSSGQNLESVWSDAVNLSQSGTGTTPGTITLDGNGNPHVAWWDIDGYYCNNDRITACTSDAQCPGSFCQSHDVISYLRWDSGSKQWVDYDYAIDSNPRNHTAVPAQMLVDQGARCLLQESAISLQIDSQGQPHLLWKYVHCSNSTQPVLYQYWDSGSGAWKYYGANGVVPVWYGPAMVLDAEDRPHVVSKYEAGGGNPNGIQYRYGDPATEQWYTVTGDLGTDHLRLDDSTRSIGDYATPTIAIDSGGNPHVAWGAGGNGDALYRKWDGEHWVTASGAYGNGDADEDFNVTQVNPATEEVKRPVLKLDSNDIPYIAFNGLRDGVGMRRAYLKTWIPEKGEWGTMAGDTSPELVGEAVMVSPAGAVYYDGMALDIGAGDVPYVGWAAGDGEAHARRWSIDQRAWVTVSGDAGTENENYSQSAEFSRYPLIAVSGEGVVHTIWRDEASTGANECSWNHDSACIAQPDYPYCMNEWPTNDCTGSDIYYRAWGDIADNIGLGWVSFYRGTCTDNAQRACIVDADCDEGTCEPSAVKELGDPLPDGSMGYGFCYTASDGVRYGTCAIDTVTPCEVDSDCPTEDDSCVHYTCSEDSTCRNDTPASPPTSQELCRPVATAYLNGSTMAVEGWARVLALKEEGESQGFDDWGWVKLNGTYNDGAGNAGPYSLTATEVDSQQFLGDPDVNPNDVSLYSLFGWSWSAETSSYTPADSRWLERENVSGDGLSHYYYKDRDSSMVLDRDGNPHVAWSSYNADEQRYSIYYVRQQSGHWVTATGEEYVPGTTNPASSKLDVGIAAGLLPPSDTDDLRSPSLAIDVSGRPHVALQKAGSATEDGTVYYTYWNGTDWAAGSCIDGRACPNAYDGIGALGAQQPTLQLDAATVPHVVYRRGEYAGYGIYYVRLNGGLWEPINGNPANLNVAASSTGECSGNPSLPCLTDAECAGSGGICWHRAYDPEFRLQDGVPHVLWIQKIFGGTNQVYYRWWDEVNGVWSDADGGADMFNTVSVTQGLAGIGNIPNPAVPEVPSLALFSDGRPAVAWRDPDYIIFRQWDGAQWADINPGDGSTTDDLQLNSSLGHAYAGGEPYVMVDADDHPHVLWGDDYSVTQNPHIFYRRWDPAEGPAGSWVTVDGNAADAADTPHYRVSPIGSDYSISPISMLDAIGNAHVLWTEVTRGAEGCGFGYDGVLTSQDGDSDFEDVVLDSTGTYLYAAGTDADEFLVEKRRADTGLPCSATNCGTEFGTNGAILSAGMPGGDGVAYAVGLDEREGSLYVAGRAVGGGGFQWIIYKFDAGTGALCTGGVCGAAENFGAAGYIQIASTYAYYGMDMKINDGFMYLFGSKNISPDVNDWVVERRHLTNGSLVADSYVGGWQGGRIEIPAGYLGAAIVIDGRDMYIAGSDDDDDGVGGSDTYDWRIEKRSAFSGQLASAFGAGGVWTGPGAGDAVNSYKINDLEIAGDALYAGGFVDVEDWLTAKFDKNTGALDTAFGGDGFVQGPEVTKKVYGITAGGDGLYVVGWSNDNWRYEKLDLNTGANIATGDYAGGWQGGVIEETWGDAASVAREIVLDDRYMYAVGSSDERGSVADWRIEKRYRDTGQLITERNENCADPLLPTCLETGWANPPDWNITYPDGTSVSRCSAVTMSYAQWAPGAVHAGLGWIEFMPAGALLGIPWVQTMFSDIYASEAIALSPPPRGTGGYTSTFLILAGEEGDTITGIPGYYSGAQTGAPTSSYYEPGFDPLITGAGNPLGEDVLDRLNISGLVAETATGSGYNQYGHPLRIDSSEGTVDISQSASFGGDPSDITLDGTVYYFSSANPTTRYVIGREMTFKAGSEPAGTAGDGLIVIDGDLEINRDILYEERDLADISEMPSVAIVVRGNVYISPFVSELAGAYVAVDDPQTAEASEGIIHTGRQQPFVAAIAASADDTSIANDAYANDTGAIQQAFGQSEAGVDSRSFIRWQLDIPAGAEIRDAYLRLHADDSASATLDPFSAKIRLIDSADASGIDFTANPNAGLYGIATGNSVSYPISSATWQYGAVNETPDISALIQRFIDDSAYVPGASMVGIAIDEGDAGTGDIVSFYSYDYYQANPVSEPDYVPELVIEYSPQRTVYTIDNESLGGFGSGGVADTDYEMYNYKLAVDEPNNALYAAGVFRWLQPPSAWHYDWRIEKRTLDTGELDTTFGMGQCIADPTYYCHVNADCPHNDCNAAPTGIINLGGIAGYAYDVHVDDNFIYVAGSRGGSRITKYDKATGALCTAGACGAGEDFGTGGYQSVTISFSGGANILGVDSNFIYVNGYYTSGGTRMRTAKISRATGALCTGGACGAGEDFGTGGYRDSSLTTTYGYGIAVDGEFIYTIGRRYISTPTTNWMHLEKYEKHTGALCTAGACGAGEDFGAGGMQDFPSANAQAYGRAITVSGDVLFAAGYTTGFDFLTAKYNKHTGELCSILGGCGVHQDFNFQGYVISTNGRLVYDVAADAEYVYVAGLSDMGASQYNMYVERYTHSGQPEPFTGHATNAIVETNGRQAYAVKLDSSAMYIGGFSYVGSVNRWMIEKRDRLTGDLVGSGANEAASWGSTDPQDCDTNAECDYDPVCMNFGRYKGNPNRVFLRFAPPPADDPDYTQLPASAEIINAQLKVTGRNESPACFDATDTGADALQGRIGLLSGVDIASFGCNPNVPSCVSMSQEVSEVTWDIAAGAWADGTEYLLPADIASLVDAWVDLGSHQPEHHIGLRVRRGTNETDADDGASRALYQEAALPGASELVVDYQMPLLVNGLFVAEGYSFDRKYTKNLAASEQILYDGRVVANTPPGLSDFTEALPIYDRVP
ncbi:MAG: hypothetical protein WC505_04755 [Patescibacteria group bacterium]